MSTFFWHLAFNTIQTHIETSGWPFALRLPTSTISISPPGGSTDNEYRQPCRCVSPSHSEHLRTINFIFNFHKSRTLKHFLDSSVQTFQSLDSSKSTGCLIKVCKLWVSSCLSTFDRSSILKATASYGSHHFFLAPLNLCRVLYSRGLLWDIILCRFAFTICYVPHWVLILNCP